MHQSFSKSYLNARYGANANGCTKNVFIFIQGIDSLFVLSNCKEFLTRFFSILNNCFYFFEVVMQFSSFVTCNIHVNINLCLDFESWENAVLRILYDMGTIPAGNTFKEPISDFHEISLQGEG